MAHCNEIGNQAQRCENAEMSKPKRVGTKEVVALLQRSSGYVKALNSWKSAATKKQKELFTALNTYSDRKLLDFFGPYADDYDVSGVKIGGIAVGLTVNDILKNRGMFFDLSKKNDQEFFIRYGDVFRYPMELSAGEERLGCMCIFGEVVQVWDDFVTAFAALPGSTEKCFDEEVLDGFPDLSRKRKCRSVLENLRIIEVGNPLEREEHPLYLLVNQDFDSSYVGVQITEYVFQREQAEKTRRTTYKGINREYRWSDVLTDLKALSKPPKQAIDEAERKRIERASKKIKELISYLDRD